MQLVQIKYFLAACTTNNFTHAAKACNVTQPALTRSIGLLEEELGGKLFLREHHLTQLTPFGRTMRAHFEQILAETEKLRQAAKDYKLRHGTALNLGILTSIGPRHFIELLREFGAANKNMQLGLHGGVQDRLLSLLLDGTLHLAISTRPAVEDERLRWHELYRERFVLALPEGHRLQRPKSVRLADLGHDRHVIWCRSEYLDGLRAACRDAGLDFDVETECEREEWALGLVAAGIGIAILPESAAAGPGLVTRPIADLDFMREVHLVYVDGREDEMPISRFLRTVRSHHWAGQAAATAR
ncbi:MAG TPA: LysR family transcriptional regulator [Aliidongia sp.]|nr:LysR family transcriptional regulator [Aliidongia sp.]